MQRGGVADTDHASVGERRLGLHFQLTEVIDEKLESGLWFEEQPPWALELGAAGHGIERFAASRAENELLLVDIERIECLHEGIGQGLADAVLTLKLAQRGFGQPRVFQQLGERLRGAFLGLERT